LLDHCGVTHPPKTATQTTRRRELIEGVQQLRDTAAPFADHKLPQPALRHVDEGGHPDDYVRQLVTAALRDNQVGVRGRVCRPSRLRE